MPILLFLAVQKIDAEAIQIKNEIEAITRDYSEFKKDWQALVDARKEKFRPQALIFALVGALAIYGGASGILYEPTSIGKFYASTGAVIWGIGGYAGWHYFTRARTEQRCVCKFREEFEKCFEKLNSAKDRFVPLIKIEGVADEKNIKLYWEIKTCWEKHFSQLNQCPRN